jgi:hypothetical protein
LLGEKSRVVGRRLRISIASNTRQSTVGDRKTIDVSTAVKIYGH